MSDAPGIRLDGVTLRRGSHVVFDALSMSIPGGRWHAVLGRSGVGKSSLLRLIAALQRPDTGVIEADDAGPLPPRVTYMAQDDGLLPWLSALDNVQLGARLRGEVSARSGRRAVELLSRVGLEGWERVRPGRLSGGMRQRVALARTLMEDRSIVLMDEPFAHLDALTRDELQRLAVESLARRTVVLVTHDPVEAAQLAHGVTLLLGGRPSGTSTRALFTAPPREPDDPLVLSTARELRERLGGGTRCARAVVMR